MANIIIPGRTKMGRTRSEVEVNLRKEWGSTITDEQLDKMKYMEKKAKEVYDNKDNFFKPQEADHLEE